METTQTTTQAEPSSTNDLGIFPRRSHRWFFLKALLAFLILIVTFIAGICWGSAFSRLRQLQRMEGASGFRTESIRSMFDRNDLRVRKFEEKSVVSFFGSIVRIEGSKITIFNNASQEQLLVSQSDTVITVQDRLISVAQLAPGQLIGGVGLINADGSMIVKQLWILP